MRVLILGANGLFGHRISKLFAMENKSIDVLLGCRDITKSLKVKETIMIKEEQTKFHEFSTGTIPTFEDNKNIEKHKNQIIEIIKSSKANVIINTVGPFIFPSNLKENEFPPCFYIAKYCGMQGIHYIDLGEERNYLDNFIKYLDPIAKEKNVFLLSGASTTPGLTMEIIKILTNENPSNLYENSSKFDSISSITWALSPGNKIGKHGSANATIESILQSLGKKIPNSLDNLSKDQENLPLVWSNIHKYPFRWLNSKRYVAKVNQYDIDLINKNFPSNISVSCYAGIELSILTWVLGILSKVFYFFPFLKPFIIQLALKSTKLTRNLGSNEGGFSVSVKGFVDDKNIERRWDLIAQNEHGPFIPAIPSVIAAFNILNLQNKKDNKWGAYICGDKHSSSFFSFDDFNNIIESHKLNLYWSIFDEKSNSSKYLYYRILGSNFNKLPFLIREMHSYNENIIASGHCDVIRGNSFVAKLMGSYLGLANEGKSVPTTVNLVTINNQKHEFWLRNFEGKRFRTIQFESKNHFGLLKERINVSLHNLKNYENSDCGNFNDFLTTDAVALIKGNSNGLFWEIKKYIVFNGYVSLPKFLHANSTAEETVVLNADGNEYFQFNVKIYLPLKLGLLVHYKGTLKINKQ